MVGVQEVCVDFAGGGRRTVSEGLSNVVHGNSLCIGDAGKAVSQAVEGDGWKIMVVDEFGE